MENRPDRKQAVAQVAQHEAQVSLAERQRFPDIVAARAVPAARIRRQRTAAADALGRASGSRCRSSTSSRARSRRAEAERQTALVTRRRLETLVVADLESAVNTFSTARRIVERYESSLLERAKRARDITQVQFNAGSATLDRPSRRPAELRRRQQRLLHGARELLDVGVPAGAGRRQGARSMNPTVATLAIAAAAIADSR